MLMTINTHPYLAEAKPPARDMRQVGIGYALAGRSMR
jgi:hypothetical protein